MERRVLIVGSKENQVIGKSIAKLLDLIGVHSDFAAHDEALATLLSEDYSHVIISDYSEKKDKDSGGFASYRDIAASATGQKVIRCGFEELDYKDYIRYPSLATELYKKLED